MGPHATSTAQACERLFDLMSIEPERALPCPPDPYSPPWWSFHDAWIANYPMDTEECFE